MSEYYRHFLSSMTGVGAQTNQPLPDASQQPQPSPGVSPSSHSLSSPFQGLGYLTNCAEPIVVNASKLPKSRRRSTPGPDHVKHRRTKSGCFTCRTRRVKCDEGRPICERCRKGKRECAYPDPPPPRGSLGQGSKECPEPSQHTSPSSSRGEEEEEAEQDLALEPIVDEGEDQEDDIASQPSTCSAPQARGLSAAASFSHPPSASDLGRRSNTPPPPETSRPNWSRLPHDLQFYLNYFYEEITHYHYCIIHDPDNFFQSTLLSAAVREEALLYAVAAFSAYHHALRDPNGQISQFLHYYDRSVKLLLAFLQKQEKHNIGTLLTILQLATIEEYLGDWVSLLGHQKAAFELLTHMYSPESAMQSPAGRMILTWYARFDVFVGIIGRFETALPREWFSTFVEYCEAQVATAPGSLAWKFEACIARLRLISMEISILLGKSAKKEVVGDAYAAEHRKLAKKLEDWKASWDPALTDPAFMVAEFGNMQPADFGNPYPAGVLYRQPLFPSTLLMCEWHSIMVLHESQETTETVEGEQLARLGARALAVCQIFQAIEQWPLAPNGSLFVAHACLAIAALFVPRDSQHHMWIREKFALLESLGCIYPLTMRTRMAELFRDETCLRWWLPNDKGATPIVKSLRTFADERNLIAATSAQTASLREIRHIFEKTNLGKGGRR